MGDLSENFSRWEFACKGKKCCGGSAPVSEKLINGLEEFRENLCIILGKDVPVTVLSGFRCKVHNASEEVGGEEDSRHPKADGADVTTEASPHQMAKAAKMVNVFRFGGIGRYHNRLHLDTRPDGPARWAVNENGAKIEFLSKRNI